MKMKALLLALLLPICAMAQNQNAEKIQNPMLWADVPDPDVIRVGDTYYLVTTTMHLMPGAPVMASKDLKNWAQVRPAGRHRLWPWSVGHVAEVSRR